MSQIWFITNGILRAPLDIFKNPLILFLKTWKIKKRSEACRDVHIVTHYPPNDLCDDRIGLYMLKETAADSTNVFNAAPQYGGLLYTAVKCYL